MIKLYWRRKIFRVVIILAVILIGASLIIEGWINKKVGAAGSGARPAIRAVLTAFYWSKVSGSYWENTLLDQKSYIAKLPLQERLDFFRVVSLECDFQSYRVLLFEEMVGADAVPFYQHLRTYKQSANYKKLNDEQKATLEDWLISMQLLATEQCKKSQGLLCKQPAASQQIP